MSPTRASRGRPPGARRRGSLSREEILEAGFRIARRSELSQLTMKKLADELGVTPMAIYRHFRNKAEVVDGVLDLFVRDAAVSRHGCDPKQWRRWLALTFGAMHQALLEAPSVMPFLPTASRFGPAALAVLDETLSVLREAGFEDEEAVSIFLSLTSYTIGATGFRVGGRGGRGGRGGGARGEDESRRQVRLWFEAAPIAQLPHVVALAPQLARGLSELPFEFGLELMLDSLARRRGDLPPA